MHTKLPIINFFQKLIIFFYCLIFGEFKNESSNSKLLRPIAWAGVIKKFIQFFSESCPSGYQIFSNDFKVKVSVYQDGLTTNNDHQSFQNPHYSKFGNIFIIFFYLLFKIKHHPTSRKKQNEKLFFVFFLELKTYFLFWQKSKFSNLNDVMKFINTKTKNFFFQFFLTEKSTTRVSALLSTCKKKY